MKTNVEKVEQIEKHMSEIMDILGIERTSSNVDTPKRVAKMWVNELFKNEGKTLDELDHSMKVFPNKYNNDIVVLKDIEFHSICEHHWLPFSGKISIGYAPAEKIIGLSKIPRVVKYFSQKPQLQEKLVEEVGTYLNSVLKPLFLFIRAEAVHQCVACRGAEANCSTVNRWMCSNVSPEKVFEYGSEYWEKEMLSFLDMFDKEVH